ncbi:hypothetical protein [Kribbella sp. CA-293567]|uniref:hypothetical protein n=1 Tax=Kribbella sp. CA-293567 TaxID=3002436 RepID=UPI0022DD549F|nr:hypothetical protein [Kribbella sp. CA-293567]WBQ05843.1 hypothetical protein OX958_03355 [Kribbella sp. CA-293567]
MSARGYAQLAAVAMVSASLLLVACGNDAEPAGGGGAGTPSAGAPSSGAPSPGAPSAGTPSAGTPSAGVTPSGKPTPERSGGPVNTPAKPPVPTPSPGKPAKLTTAMLLTGPEVAKADPNRGWTATSGTASTPICGRASTRGDNPLGSLNRNFTTDLDASGGQWLTRYADAKAARAAYDQILKTIKSCKAALPAPTHARKLTENRALPLGDATRIIRWYDYPLPSDPGSEDGGFPYAITLKNNVISVLAFGEMGKGIKPANFERLARTAVARLG